MTGPGRKRFGYPLQNKELENVPNLLPMRQHAGNGPAAMPVLCPLAARRIASEHRLTAAPPPIAVLADFRTYGDDR